MLLLYWLFLIIPFIFHCLNCRVTDSSSFKVVFFSCWRFVWKNESKLSSAGERNYQRCCRICDCKRTVGLWLQKMPVGTDVLCTFSSNRHHGCMLLIKLFLLESGRLNRLLLQHQTASRLFRIYPTVALCPERSPTDSLIDDAKIWSRWHAYWPIDPKGWMSTSQSAQNSCKKVKQCEWQMMCR